MLPKTKLLRRASLPTHLSQRGISPACVPAIIHSFKLTRDKKTDVLRRVLVANVLDFPIVQQPGGNDQYISPVDGEITEFDTPSNFGNVGLLAHNYLSGRYFSEFTQGQGIQLVYGNAMIETFVVTDILQYQALQPDNPYSLFRDLNSNETMTAAQVFEKTYKGSRRVTFQTCVAAGDSSMWGRLFVIATSQKLPGSIPWN